MKRVFIMRKDLGMSPGKLAVQVGHCAEEYWLNLIKNHSAHHKTDSYAVSFEIPADVMSEYIGFTTTKTVCAARDKKHLMKAKDVAESLGLRENIDFGFIHGICLTELHPEEEDNTVITGMWFRPLDEHIANQISYRYQLY